MGRKRKYDESRVVSLKVNAAQYSKLSECVSKLGFPSLSQLIKACINKGLPLVKEERNGQGD